MPSPHQPIYVLPIFKLFVPPFRNVFFSLRPSALRSSTLFRARLAYLMQGICSLLKFTMPFLDFASLFPSIRPDSLPPCCVRCLLFFVFLAPLKDGVLREFLALIGPGDFCGFLLGLFYAFFFPFERECRRIPIDHLPTDDQQVF